MGSSSNRSITFSGAYRRCRGSANLPMCRYWRDREGREIGAWNWDAAAIEGEFAAFANTQTRLRCADGDRVAIEDEAYPHGQQEFSETGGDH